MFILRKQNYRSTPWKNGLGHTDEIAIHPATATSGSVTGAGQTASGGDTLRIEGGPVTLHGIGTIVLISIHLQPKP